ncbi:hypothetical protein DFJ58DRAFT_367252 [Suillus subalutaceus]|uniref:uncharacterized protein n=1 Tax=Suillus subalutaceus TaxID=48586 RepID=UPI001B85C44A|nr:uncharacterized protein DFJ58DRAFT_367252 [Suillus subalutaceus]KAG1873663.1 hypothetical protein DFJ58DRAFT_367252 [Suillus subalutaceus]
MQLTFVTDLGQSYAVDIDPDMELENVMALLEAEVSLLLSIIQPQLIHANSLVFASSPFLCSYDDLHGTVYDSGSCSRVYPPANKASRTTGVNLQIQRLPSGRLVWANTLSSSYAGVSTFPGPKAGEHLILFSAFIARMH